MNFIFWGAMLLMLLVAMSLLVFPLLRVRGTEAVAYKDSNLSLYEAKLQELDTDLAEDRIDQEHYRIAREELDRELLDNVPDENRDTASEHYGAHRQRHPILALTIAVMLPAFAMLLYMEIGMHAVNEQSASQAVQPSQASVEEMTTKLENYLQANVGGVQEWRMLGRAYKHLGRYDDAADAFNRALELQPDAELMLEKAEAIALANEQTFTSESRTLILQAKQLEPNNINVLWFAGVAEFQAGNYHASIDNLAALAAIGKVDADVNKSIRLYIEKARAELIANGETIASVDELLRVEKDLNAVVKAGPASASLRVTVTVNDEVRAKFKPGDIVFVYAKAAQGPQMPLAVQRMTLGALPATVTLDDSMAMIDSMNLSAFPSVVVAARISRSGSAIAQSGDYIGEFQVNNVNSTQTTININIDRVVQ